MKTPGISQTLLFSSAGQEIIRIPYPMMSKVLHHTFLNGRAVIIFCYEVDDFVIIYIYAYTLFLCFLSDMASSTPPPLIAKVMGSSDSTVADVTNDNPNSAESSPVARTSTSHTAMEIPKQSLVAKEAVPMATKSDTVAIELTSSEDEGQAGAKNSESDSGA